MNCKEFKKLIPRYDGEILSEKQTKEFHAHIDSCIECSILFQKFSNTLKLLQPKVEIEEQAYYFTRLKQRMENYNVQHELAISKIFSRKLVQPVIYLSSIILAVYIGILIGSGSVNQTQYSEVKNNETNYIQSYAEYQYLNDFEIEPIENLLLDNNNTVKE